MKQVPDEFELVDEPSHWAFRYPGVAMALVAAAFPVTVIAFGVWLDDRQRPQLEEIRTAITTLGQENRQLATFQLETSRYIGLALAGISESANVKMPDRPEALKRAAEHVRKIQDRVN